MNKKVLEILSVKTKIVSVLVIGETNYLPLMCLFGINQRMRVTKENLPIYPRYITDSIICDIFKLTRKKKKFIIFSE
jgi:hypothetical protein